MAAVANLWFSSYTPPSIFFHDEYSISSSHTFSHTPLLTKTRLLSSLKFQAKDHCFFLMKDSTNNLDFEKIKTAEKIREIHCIDEYDKELQLSTQKLVIAHFSASHYKHNNRIQRFMTEQSRVSNEVKFLHVMADESEKTRQLCSRENIDKIPYFVFYRKTVRMHEEAGFQPEKLVNNILYYTDPFSTVVQLQYCEDLEKLIEIHKLDNKLIVVNVGMRNCVPCVKIYPSVVKLASYMSGRVIFARINADAEDRCMKTLREMGVSKVPAFLFLKNGELCGRYVGSNTSSLIREIVKIA